MFKGFGTKYKVEYEEARVMAAAYNYVEKTNDIAFNVVKNYLNVLKFKELHTLEKENILLTQDILDKYNSAYQADIYVTDKIVSYVPIVPLDYTKQQSVKDMTNNLVNPASYDIEYAISTIVKKYVYLKIKEYDFYDRKIKETF